MYWKAGGDTQEGNLVIGNHLHFPVNQIRMLQVREEQEESPATSVGSGLPFSPLTTALTHPSGGGKRNTQEPHARWCSSPHTQTLLHHSRSLKIWKLAAYSQAANIHFGSRSGAILLVFFYRWSLAQWFGLPFFYSTWCKTLCIQ